jgi:hypothetical protein
METRERLHDSAPSRTAESRLADCRDALAGMAAQLQEAERRTRHHEAEKAELAARIADLDHRNAVLHGLLDEAASAASTRVAGVQRELDAERERTAALREQVEAGEQALVESNAAVASLRERVAALEAEQSRSVPEPDAVPRDADQGDDAGGNAAEVALNDGLLVSLEGDTAASHSLCKPIMVIGRSIEADICVQGTHTSRRHARLFVDADAVVVEDMGSLNGTLLNNRPVRKRKLRHGDVLNVGGARLRFVRPSERPDAPGP